MTKFCVTCGSQIDKGNVCPKCGSVQNAEYARRRFCGNCGTALKHEGSACPKCSPKLPLGVLWKRTPTKTETALKDDLYLLWSSRLKRAIKKIPEIIAFILLLPAILVAMILFPDIDIDRLEDKGVIVFMLICYGLLAFFIWYYLF